MEQQWCSVMCDRDYRLEQRLIAQTVGTCPAAQTLAQDVE